MKGLASDCGFQKSDLTIEDKDFTTTFDGECWSVKWKWSSSKDSEFNQQLGNYSVALEHREKIDQEIKEWIEKGWLVPAGNDEKAKFIIPLLAVFG